MATRDACNEDGDTALHLHIIYEQENEALREIALHPHLIRVQNNLFQTPLHLAVLLQQRTVVTRLLSAGVDAATLMDHNGNTPLHLACLHHSLRDMVDLLLTRGDIWSAYAKNYDGHTCLQLAVEGNNAAVVPSLLKHLCDETGILAGCGKSGRSAVHMAVDRGYEKILGMLLERCTEDLNVYHRDYAGLTPMDLACSRNNEAMIQMLVSYDRRNCD